MNTAFLPTLILATTPAVAQTATPLTYPIVDTSQGTCHNNSELIDWLAEGEAFFGQDAQYTGITANYNVNCDGTVTDNVTGLIWAQELSEASVEWDDAPAYCTASKSCNRSGTSLKGGHGLIPIISISSRTAANSRNTIHGRAIPPSC